MLTGRRAYKYSVTIDISKIHLSISFPCQLKVSTVKNRKRHETKTTNLDLESCTAIFEDRISFEATYLQDIKTFLWIEDVQKINVSIIDPRRNKTAGYYNLSIPDVLHQGRVNRTMLVYLQKCPDDSATLELSINLQKIRELTSQEYQDELEAIELLSRQTDITVDRFTTGSQNQSRVPGFGGGGSGSQV